ncbi:hypothetical protein DM01DRAFT_1166373 [Hesseltinella vesiculosa]|uniref:Serine aminopeptidase S33 domain-containing protein n=1 Tax=Hesseltinella vesiculosa TaxID=101127 RepID=A0A1X2G5R5_9FUNG|nr:hypothetical protein DM01DRAFT_1166373 [Hesseltinella vesiculosa]
MADLTIKNDKGERLVGILEKPDLKGRGLILILHGFLTHKDSLWQKKLALSLPYPSYRFDSYGHGDSDGVYRYPNIVKGAENLRTVASYFDSQGWKIFGVVGYSGGAFAVHDFVLNWHYQIKHVSYLA